MCVRWVQIVAQAPQRWCKLRRVKKCPFCAEDIQDAAIVCKHCGRNLPTPQAAASKRNRLVLLSIAGIVVVGVVVVAVLAAVLMQVSPTSVNEHDREGKCQLHARAAVVTRDTPLGQ